MKAATFEGTGKIVVKDVPDPELQNPDEAIVKVTHSCICGSDLWFYRGLSPQAEGSRIGHEFIGVVEAAGNDVKTVTVGEFVIAPFVISDGVCPECTVGETRFCRHGMFFGTDGCALSGSRRVSEHRGGCSEEHRGHVREPHRAFA